VGTTAVKDFDEACAAYEVEGRGFADAERTIKLTPTSRMLAGSTGKTFVAAAILQAVDEGKLDLDSRIEKWIGKEEWFAGASWNLSSWSWNRKVS
jgi:CubicO group peptidase (beta-lactamase class C family)